MCYYPTMEKQMTTSLKPVFVLQDDQFTPRPSHPGDAGADIKVFVEGGFDYSASVRFYRDFESYSLKYGYRMYIDGQVFTSESESDFLHIVKECNGAVFLPPGETVLVSTGFRVILPSFRHMPDPWNQFSSVYKIVPRSGLANNHGITVTNSPGIIDSGYRGIVKVSLTNETGKGILGDNYHVFTHGSRVAQGLCELVVDQSNSEVITNLPTDDSTSRSIGGFGSTGV